MLDADLLLDAYRHGIFPMAVNPGKGVGAGQRGDIGWFSPDPRAVIPLDDKFHVPHGLRRVWKRCVIAGEGEAPAEPRRLLHTTRGSPGGSPSQMKFVITFDTNFETVIRECAKRKEGTWISKEIIESYCNLHRLGHAHSVEVWHPRVSPKLDEGGRSHASTLQRSSRPPLAGGLYGVHIGGAFFGESMFHRATDASKVALVALVERLRARDFALLDTQWLTPHLAQFGTHEIPKHEYLHRLGRAVTLNRSF